MDPGQAHENRRCFPAGMLLQLLLHRRLLQRAAQIGAELFLMLAQVHRLCNEMTNNLRPETWLASRRIPFCHLNTSALPISAISRNVWRMCLEKEYRGCLGGRSQRAETTQKWWRWLRWRCPRRQGSRVATDTPFIIIMDSNRFLVLRSIGNGAAIQAAAHPRHRISHDGSSPQALGGMWGARGVAKRNT